MRSVEFRARRPPSVILAAHLGDPLEPKKARLGEQLVAAGILPREYLELGLNAQKAQGGYLGEVLVSLGLLGERELLQFLANRDQLQFLSSEKLSQLKIDDEVLERFPVRTAERLDVLPIKADQVKKSMILAVPDLETVETLDELKEALEVKTITPILAMRSAIRAGIRRFYYRDNYAFAALDGRGLTRAPAPPREAPASKAEVTEISAKAPVAKPQDKRNPERELHLLKVANSLQRHLLGERDILQLVHRVLAFAFDNLPADEGLFLLRDADTGQLVPRAIRSRVGQPEEVQISDSLVREMLETRKSVLTMDAVVDSRFGSSETVAGARMRSAIGVPIIAGDVVHGAILLVARTHVSRFEETDLEVLEAIAAQTSLWLEVAELTRQMTAEAATRERLSRFMSPALVELVSTGKLQVGESGIQQEATILFADVRGFTTLSENLEPADVVQLLNHHFDAMVELVFGHGGTLDKFLGDALMAIWGAPMKRPNDELRAIACALQMLGRVKEMNEAREREGKRLLEIGIGINTGRVVFGAMGATRRMDLTVIGDAVNTAHRLCERALPGQLVVGETTFRKYMDQFDAEALAPMQLKGKKQTTRAFLVKGVRGA